MRAALLLLILLSLPCLAQPRVQLDLGTGEVRQGDVIKVGLRMDSATLQGLPIREYLRKPLQETLYFFEISPPVRKAGEDSFTADAQVTFLKVPQANSLTYKAGNVETTFSWTPVIVKAVEVPKSFIFKDFDIPRVKSWLPWIAAMILALVLGLLTWRLWGRRRAKREGIQRKRRLKERALGCSEYGEVVELWKEKQTLLAEFPALGEAFARLEVTLYKHIFRPQVSPAERQDVLRAYREFRDAAEGGFGGI